MPWCPKCRNEYVEGITVCADCQAELVDSLEDVEKKALYFGEEEQIKELADFLAFNEIYSANIVFDDETMMYEVFVAETDEEKARKVTAVFLQKEAEKGKTDSTAEGATHQNYQKKSERAEELKNSGIVLISVGVIGLILIVLNAIGVITLPINETTKYLITVVLGAMLISFILFGIHSMRSCKKYEKEGIEENKLEEEILTWCKENVTKESVDEALSAEEEELTEEMKYFKRTEKMKQMILRTYADLEEGFLDQIVDDFYPKIFDQCER